MSEGLSSTTADATTPPLKQKTGGEKLFNAGVYYGIGWGVNTASSVYLTDKALNKQSGMFGAWEKLYNAREVAQNWAQECATKLLQKPEILEEAAEAFKKVAGKELNNQNLYHLWEQEGRSFEKLAKTLGLELEQTLTPETMRELRDYIVQNEANGAGAKSLATIFLLCTGGFLTLIPVKLLEDHKLPLVQFLDEHVVDKFLALTGHAPQTEAEQQQRDATRQQRYQQIEHEPHQTWASEFASRMMAVIPIYTAHTLTGGEYNIIKSGGARLAGVDYVNPDKNVGFAGVGNYLEKAGEYVGNKVLKVAPEAYRPFGSVDRFKQNAQWLTGDCCYTWVSATLTYLGSRLLAPILGKKEEGEELPSAANNVVPIQKVSAAERQGTVQVEPLRSLTAH
jgi:hypothetical protein